MSNFLLKSLSIFDSISDDEYNTIIKQFSIKKSYKKNQIIFSENDNIYDIAIITKGEIQITKNYFNGDRNIITKLHEKKIFGLSFVCAKIYKIPFTVTCSEDAEIVFIKYKNLESNVNLYSKIVSNILYIISKKNITLSQKMEYLSKRSIKEKIMAYLNDEAIFNNSNTFNIPYNREELANYLCIDRSAMSLVLSKMKKEHILSFNKNTFTIL